MYTAQGGNNSRGLQKVVSPSLLCSVLGNDDSQLAVVNSLCLEVS